MQDAVDRAYNRRVRLNNMTVNIYHVGKKRERNNNALTH